MRRLAVIASTVLVFASLLSSCAETTAIPGGGELDVLTTSTILADLAQNVAGERLVVEPFLPTGADPHSYQPTPQDIARISETSVLIINGAGYEGFLESVLENAKRQGTLIDASSGLDLRTDAEHGVDPHLWLDPNQAIGYVENIQEGLTAFDPDGAETYRSNTKAYIQQLHDLDAWIEQQVAQIPPERRVLVTNHEAFGYFAERYGFTVLGTIVESVSSNASPSARQMAALIDQIRQSGAPAIFLDASDNPDLAQQIAAETGATVVTELHLESLTDGPPAATYIDLMKHNVTKIVESLR
jgi:ABC-type Zn uptake system ZnuABC Zn-binding protein ZnuA